MSLPPEHLSLAGGQALVTGGSRGIGLAIARVLRGAGCGVMLVARGEAALEAAAAAIGGIPLPADVAQEGEVATLHHRFLELAGREPDVVVNAAGAFGLAALADTAVVSFDRMIAVNLRAPFLLVREFLPGMLARGSGHFVTIGSVAGRMAFPHNGAYAASKFGVRGLHAVLDTELRGTGVRATLIEPAATDTALWDAVDAAAHPGLPPREAMLSPDDVAEAVLFAVTRPSGVDVRTLLLERT